MKFLRRIHNRYSKLGKRRKKKQVWRRPTGRDNKMRENRKGYPAKVKIGYKNKESKERIAVYSPKELENANKENIIVIGKVGKKKKLEIAKKAKKMKLEIQNLNYEKFLKNNKTKEKKNESK